MQKPNGYDETQVKGSWEAPEVGGHYLIIKKVEERKSSTGKDMIAVMFDFAKNDKQAGLFMKTFEEDIRPDKKWPYAGSAYIMVNDYNDESKTSKNFKTFVTSVEKSNTGFVTTWGDNWGQQFKNKIIGAVFGKVESEYNGNRSMRTQLRWFCSSSAVANAKVPDPKLLPAASGSSSAPFADAVNEDFMKIPEGVEEEIPF